MYSPFVALAKRFNLASVYWRMPYLEEDESALWFRNDAFLHPDWEMSIPPPVCMYKLEDPPGSTSAADNIWNMNGGTYTHSSSSGTNRTPGPKFELSGEFSGYGTGRSRHRQQDVFCSQHDYQASTAQPSKMIGRSPATPLPPGQSAADERYINPVGITGFPFTFNVWVKIIDNQETFDGDDGTTLETYCPAVSLAYWKKSGSTWGNSSNFQAMLEVMRFGTGGEPGMEGCFGIRATLHTALDDGTPALQCTASPTHDHWHAMSSPLPFFLGTEHWVLVTAEFTDRSISLYMNGSFLHTRTRSQQHDEDNDLGGIPGNFVFPTHTENKGFQVGLNCDLLDEDRNGLPSVAYSHLCILDQKLTQYDMMRQANSMRRYLDMRVPQPARVPTYGVQGPYHHLAPLSDTRVAGFATRFEAAQSCQFRTDNRYMYFLGLGGTFSTTPILDLTGSSGTLVHNLDVGEPSYIPPGTAEEVLLPRMYWDNPDPEFSLYEADIVDGADQSNLVNQYYAASSVQELFGGSQYGEPEITLHHRTANGVTFIAAWVGETGTSSSETTGPATYVINYKGRCGEENSPTYWGFHAACGVAHTELNAAIDGQDGFSVERRPDGFHLWVPYGTKSTYDPSYIKGEVYLHEDVIGPAAGDMPTNQLTAMGVTMAPNAGGEDIVHWKYLPSLNKPKNESTITALAELENWPGGGAALGHLPRNQMGFAPSFGYNNHTDFTSSGHPSKWLLPRTGSTDAADSGRYLGMATFVEDIPKLAMERIMRALHGSKLMRTRPALRGCNSHVALNAPTRILS